MSEALPFPRPWLKGLRLVRAGPWTIRDLLPIEDFAGGLTSLHFAYRTAALGDVPATRATIRLEQEPLGLTGIGRYEVEGGPMRETVVTILFQILGEARELLLDTPVKPATGRIAERRGMRPASWSAGVHVGGTWIEIATRSPRSIPPTWTVRVEEASWLSTSVLPIAFLAVLRPSLQIDWFEEWAREAGVR